MRNAPALETRAATPLAPRGVRALTHTARLTAYRRWIRRWRCSARCSRRGGGDKQAIESTVACTTEEKSGMPAWAIDVGARQ